LHGGTPGGALRLDLRFDAAEKVRLETERRFATKLTHAATTYADGLAAREPIIVRPINTVREYAQTDAGRVLCRDAERVRATDALDAELAEAVRSATGALERACRRRSAGRRTGALLGRSRWHDRDGP
jgi:hypothetical protein